MTRRFLIDEDTSATNFMVRDDFMQQVISREKEPITPFLERARDLYEQAGISTILVAGSSGAFFYIADKILQMDCYCPIDITEQVKALCKEHTAPRIQAPGFCVPDFKRTLLPFNREKGYGGSRRHGKDDRHEHMKVKTFGRDSFSLDRETVDLRYVEQLADTEQTVMLGMNCPDSFGTAGSKGLGTLLRLLYSMRTCQTEKTGNFCLSEPLPGLTGSNSDAFISLFFPV